jgi:hypothetical protein
VPRYAVPVRRCTQQPPLRPRSAGYALAPGPHLASRHREQDEPRVTVADERRVRARRLETVRRAERMPARPLAVRLKLPPVPHPGVVADNGDLQTAADVAGRGDPRALMPEPHRGPAEGTPVAAPAGAARVAVRQPPHVRHGFLAEVRRVTDREQVDPPIQARDGGEVQHLWHDSPPRGRVPRAFKIPTSAAWSGMRGTGGKGPLVRRVEAEIGGSGSRVVPRSTGRAVPRRAGRLPRRCETEEMTMRAGSTLRTVDRPTVESRVAVVEPRGCRPC